MGLHEGGEAEGIGDFDVHGERFRVEKCADQQHRRRAEELRFVDHVRVHREVLAKAGRLHFCGDLPKIVVEAEKPLRLGQHGNRAGTGQLVLLRDLKVRKIRRDQALRRRRLLALADEVNVPRRAQRPLETERLRLRERQRLFPDLLQGFLFFFLRYPDPRVIRQLI